MRPQLLLLALVIAVSAVFAAEDTVGGFTLSDPATWAPIAAIVIVIHLTLVSIVYMVASFVQDEQLKAWTKNEVMQAIFSAIIIASILGAITVADNVIISPFFAQIVQPVDPEDCTDPDGNVLPEEVCHQIRTDLKYDPETNRWTEGEDNVHIDVDPDTGQIVCHGLDNCDPKFLIARSYLGLTYEKLASQLYNSIYDYSVYSTFDSMGFNFGMSFKIAQPADIGFNLGGSFPTHAVLLNTLDNLIQFMQRLMMLIKFQESVLKFFEYGLATSLIIIGIILRSIWIFRKAGGLFLSMGVAFMLVLPALYALGWYTIDIPVMQTAGITTGLAPPVPEEPEEGEMSDDFIGDSTEQMGLMGDMNIVISVIMSAVMAGFIVLRAFELATPKTIPTTLIVKTAIDPFIMTSIIATMISIAFVQVVDANDLFTHGDSIGLLDLVSRYAIVAIALPLLNFYITFAFIRGMSPLFGGDAEIPGLGRFL